MKKLALLSLIASSLIALYVPHSYGQATSTETWNGAGTTFNTAANWSGALIPNSSVFCILNGNSANRVITISAFRSHVNGLRFDSAPNGFTFVNSSSATAGELAPRGSGTISGPTGNDIVNNSGQTVTFNCPVRFYSFGAGTLNATDIQYIKTTSGNIGFNTGAFFAGTTDFALGANGGTLDFSATVGNTITVGSSSTPGVIWAGGAGAGGVIKDGAGTLTLLGNAANTYAGTTTVNAGLLTAGKVNALGAGGALAANGGILDIGTFNQSVGAVTVAGGTINGTSGTLTGTSYGLQSGTVNAKLGGASVALTKTTAGTATLGGANTYGGNTTINAGTLALGASGSIANSPNVILGGGTATFDVSAVTGGFALGSSQTLKGNGSIVGDMTINGTVSPGASIGTLISSGALALAATANTIMEINHSASPQNADLFTATSITLGGTLTISDIGGGGFLVGDAYNLFDGTLSSTFGSIAGLPTLDPSMAWDSTGIADGGDGVLRIVSVPEPSTIACFGLGIAALFMLRRRNV